MQQTPAQTTATFVCSLSGLQFVATCPTGLLANLPAIHPALFATPQAIAKTTPTTDYDYQLLITYWLRHSTLAIFEAPLAFAQVTRPLWPMLLARVAAIATNKNRQLFPHIRINSEIGSNSFDAINTWAIECLAIEASRKGIAADIQSASARVKAKTLSRQSDTLDDNLLEVAILNEQQLIARSKQPITDKGRKQLAHIAVKTLANAYNNGGLMFEQLPDADLFNGDFPKFLRTAKRVITCNADNIHNLIGSLGLKFMFQVMADHLEVSNCSRLVTAQICKLLTNHLNTLAKLDAQFAAGATKLNRRVVAGVQVEFTEIDPFGEQKTAPVTTTQKQDALAKLRALASKKNIINN